MPNSYNLDYLYGDLIIMMSDNDLIIKFQPLVIKTVQRKTHKKKRINKKWLKKYGWRIDLYKGDKLIKRDVKWEVRGTSATAYYPSKYKVKIPWEEDEY